MQQTPPAKNETPELEVLSDEAFRRAIQMAESDRPTAAERRQRKKVRRKAARVFLIELSAAFAGELASVAVTGPIPMRMAEDLAAGYIAGQLVGAPVADMVRSLYIRNGSTPKRIKKMAYMMELGSVDPQRIAAEPYLSSTVLGPIELWINLLVITQQQAVIAAALDGVSLNVTLITEIEDAYEVRNGILAALGRLPLPPESEAARRGRQALERLRRDLRQ